ncbi:MAG: DUF5074 domain-containing protein [Flavobacterium sp.]|nr:MAG: DUF5074 domain-containing protein [Flavobacterium sp.]
MKQFNSTKLFATLLLLTSLASCKKDNVQDKPQVETPNGKYADGFFLIGEGSFGRNSGTVSFYRYGADTIVARAYEQENPGKILSNTSMSSTLQFASVMNGSIYLMSKMNGPIVKVNEYTLKEEARYVQETSNWRSIIQVDGSKGLVSANDGVYQIDLNSLALGSKLSTVAALNTGDMWIKGDYVYLLQSNGAKIVSSKTYSFVKGFSNLNKGFTQTPNGKVWASTGSRLISIDNNLDTVGIALSVPIRSSYGLESPTYMTASTKENAVFYHSGTSIYKYVDGDASSVKQPFISITESPFMIYGSIRYDKNKDYLVINGIQGYGAASTVNYLLIYNASTGALVKKVTYGGDGVTVDFSKIYFNDIAVFH